MRFSKLSLWRVTLVAAGLSVLVSQASVSRADEPLRWKFKQGEKLNYNVTQDMLMNMDAGQAGKMQTNMHQVMEMTWSVQGVDEKTGDAVIEQKFDHVQMKLGGPMAFEYDSKKDAPAEGMAAMIAPLYNAMTKSSFEITMTSRGEVKAVKVPQEVLDALKSSPGAAQMGEMGTPEGFQKMIMQGVMVLPEQPPKDGDQWSTKVSMNNPMVGKQTVETTYKYGGTKEVDGVKMAVLKPSINMTIEGNPNMAINVKEQKSDGEVLFNLEAGRLSSMELNQDIAMDMTVATQAIQQQINQKIKVTVTPKDESTGTTPTVPTTPTKTAQ